MPLNNQELLIDHLDKRLQGESLPEAAALLANDADARAEFQYLQLAVEAVQYNALHAQVAAIRAEMQPKQPVVRNMTRTIFRVAAALVLLFGTLVVYKFATVSSSKFYEQHYTAYELGTNRGDAQNSQFEQEYRNKNWASVNSLYTTLPVKTNKEHFLAGMAALELKQYTEAVTRFNLVLAGNARTGDNYFQDEAEYYLALAYIANDETAKAKQLIDKIKSDTGHAYHEKAQEMPGTDLKILELK